MGNRIESLGEIQVNNVHRSPNINKAGYFVIDSDQVCQAQLAPCESTAIPNHVLQLTGDCPQEDLFHNEKRLISTITSTENISCFNQS